MLPALKPIVSMNLVAKILEIIGKTNFFHDLGLQNSLSRGRVGFDNFFPLFPRIVEEVFGIIKMVEKVVKNNSTTQAVLEAQIVEKVVFDNIFSLFHEFLRKSLES